MDSKTQLDIGKVRITLVVLDKDGKPISKQIITKENGIITSRKEDANGSD